MARGRKTGGRQSGTPNKLTAAAKDAFSFAFSEIGGAESLADWARANRTEFYKLYARMIPQELTGPGNGPVVVKVVDMTGAGHRGKIDDAR
jgi:hypothetical protein